MRGLIIGAAAIVGSGFGISSYVHPRGQIDRSVPAAREGLVVVRVPEGALTLEGWDRLEVQVTGRITGPDDRLHLSSNHGHTVVRLRPDDSPDADDTRLTLRIPKGSSVDLETVGADVVVAGVQGVVRLESGSGNLRIDGHPLGLVARSRSGDIDVTAEGVPGFAHSEDGRVTLHGGLSGALASRRVHRHLRDRYRAAGCDDARLDPAACERWEELWEEYGQEWAEWGRTYREQMAEIAPELGANVAGLMQSILERIDVEGSMDEYDGGFRFNLSGDVQIDAAALQDFVEDLNDTMEDLGDDLGRSLDDLGKQLEEVGRELERSQRERRRRRPSPR